MVNRAPKRIDTHAAALGGEKGRESSAERANRWLARFEHGVRWLARHGELAKTADAIAAQLREPPFNLPPPKSGTLEGFTVRDAFKRLGVNRKVIGTLRQQAIDAADGWGVDQSYLTFQLWHEYQKHEAINYFVLRMSFSDRSRPFVFKPEHPSRWLFPTSEHDAMLGMVGPPPWAHLAQALLGCDLETTAEDRAISATRQREHDKRKAQAEAAGEVYEGHYDDPVDIGEYIREIRERTPVRPPHVFETRPFTAEELEGTGF